MKKWPVLFITLLCVLSAHAEPLPASEVFVVSVKKIDPNTLSVNWDIKSGYFLYKDRINIRPPEDANLRLAALRFPTALTKTDKQGKSYVVYRQELSLPVSILGESPGEALLVLNYQGCSDDGFCYPPQQKQIKVSINKALELSAVALESPDASHPPASISPKSDDLSQIFSQHHWTMSLLIFYGLGLLLSFTPCILPMVPVLSGIIVGHGDTVTTKKAFLLSLSYVLSMSITYAAIGALVASLGANLQISMQSPWAITLFSFIFVLLALSMFGFYEFKLPQAWQAKLSGPGHEHRAGHYLGAAIMGCLSILILSPCVTAPLIGVLTYIAQSHNMLLGSLTLFILSLGMGTPLLLIGTSAGRWLPQAGAWMNAIKAFFGILLIATAIYLMGRILPSSITMALWGCLLVFTGVYTGALTHATTHREKFHQSAGLIFLIYGLLIIIGASMGADNPLQPLSYLKAASAQETTPLSKQQHQDISSVNQAIKEAKGTPVMLDFYADWCTSCSIIEATTLKDKAIVATLKDFKTIKIDLTEHNADTQEMMKYFKVVAPPTFIFFDSKGEQLPQLTLVGEITTKQLLNSLSKTKGA